MLFNAAKDLVYTVKGGTISSGGYRINKIVNKKKGKQTQVGGKGSDKDYDKDYDKDVYNEDSGIPIGLLLLQRLHYGDDEGDRKQKHTEVDVAPNRKLVYASIVAESDDDNGDGDNSDKINNIELVIMPSAALSTCENPIEISSNEIDDELYDSLIKSVSEPIHNSLSVNAATHLRRANATNKQNQNFGKHRDIEKVFQKRKTRSKRHH
jgi:hypothetical protein